MMVIKVTIWNYDAVIKPEYSWRNCRKIYGCIMIFKMSYNVLIKIYDHVQSVSGSTELTLLYYKWFHEQKPLPYHVKLLKV